ncbi:MAG: excinuclease ABC subunit UvrC [Planctomycetes bacterium]|nr:excinuclease ABC subunit UvrC [Planctomycetota bacterium]
MDPRIADKVARFPTGPGVYLFRDAGGTVLYAGKAADLRARVRSYLKPGGDGRYQLRFLEHDAADVEFIATATEQEALLLENTVIKKHQPRYNIKLKDDKAFLLLRLDRKEPWPWFRFVRRRRDDGALYFGPFASAKAARRTLRLLHKIVPLRDCVDAVFDNRTRPCIKHQIGRCPAPCVELITWREYDALLDQAVRILGGEIGPIVSGLTRRMGEAAEALEFERAQALKEQIAALQHVAERQAVVSRGGDEDAVGVHRRGDEVTIAFLQFRDGALEHCRRHTLKSELPLDLLLAEALQQFYLGDRYVPRAVLVPTLPEEPAMLREWLEHKRGARVELHVPQRGDRRQHLTMAQQNAALGDQVAVDMEARRRQAAERLARICLLDDAPQRLHCLDVSTMQGTNTVASRVCFVDGQPFKAQYRRFRISAEHAGDDFSAMQEAVRRSLSLCLERDDEELPDLLIVDGGKGQLAAAQRAVEELGLSGEVRLCGLAKSRLKGLGDARAESGERIFLPGRDDSMPLGVDQPETLLVAAIRDEAHRFAITYHRKQRSKITSELDSVPGVGPTRRKAMLRHFGSLTAMKQASREQLRAMPGLPQAVADAVFERLRAGAPEDAGEG